MRRLIINADDFGLTRGVNRAIAEAHSNGVITSATLMANAAEFSDAVALAKAHPKLGVGCHVVLVDGEPVSHPRDVPSLLDRLDGNDLRNSLLQFAKDATLGRVEKKQIAIEAEAQIGKIQDSGITVTHFDTHKHTHVLPQVLQPLLQTAKARGVPAVRNPFEAIRFSFLRSNSGLTTKLLGVKLLNVFAAHFRRAVNEAGLFTPDGCVGVVATGYLTQELLEQMMAVLPNGTWELVCHPGYNDSQLDSITTRLRQSREEELLILTSPQTRELLDQHGIQLASYRDLV